MAEEQIIISHGRPSPWESSTHGMGRRFYSWEAPRFYRSCEPFTLGGVKCVRIRPEAVIPGPNVGDGDHVLFT